MRGPDIKKGRSPQSDPKQSYAENDRADASREVKQLDATPTRPGITPDTLAAAGIRHVSAAEAKELCGLGVAGLWIPFHDIDGNPVEDGGKPYGRLRLDRPQSDRKYHQQAGTKVHAYIPPKLKDADASSGLVIVEGEFKALALVEAGQAAVGISGFYGWQQGEAIHPDILRAIELTGAARLLFLGDNDTALNYQFSHAAHKLASASPIPVLLPRIHLDAPGKGVDDVREVLGARFVDWWRCAVEAASEVDTEGGAGEVAVALLEAEKENLRAGRFGGMSRVKARRRLINIGAATMRDMAAFEEVMVILRDAGLFQKGDFVRAVKQARKAAKRLERANSHEVISRWATDGKEYFLHRGDVWQPMTRTDCLLTLDAQGMPRIPEQGETRSAAEEALLKIQDKRRVTYAGPLCGRPAGLHEEMGERFLATRSPSIIEGTGNGELQEPSPAYTFFENLLGAKIDPHGPRQLALFFGWVQRARKAIRNHAVHLPGQALGLIGAQDSGKSLAQHIITKLMGGREAAAGLWMTRRTDFNSDLWMAEHLVVSDENLDDDGRARKAFRDQLKGIVANPSYVLHRKHKEAVTLRPIWRLSISANDNPQSASIIPNPIIDPTIADKVILLKCYAPPVPFPTENEESRKRWYEALVSDLPNLAAVIDKLDIGDLAKGRFGVHEYIHPAIADLLEESHPDSDLAEWLEAYLDDRGTVNGTAGEIWKSLDRWRDGFIRASKNPKHLGHQLRRLQTIPAWANRIQSNNPVVRGKRRREYTIK